MNKWYNLTSVILADDMGLGKTVQIAAFLGLLGSAEWNVYPALVVVPNSTLQSRCRPSYCWSTFILRKRAYLLFRSD